MKIIPYVKVEFTAGEKNISYYCRGDMNHLLVGGFSPTPLKNDGVKVSWEG